MGRRFCVVLAAVALDSMLLLQLAVSSLICLLFLLAHIYYKPYATDEATLLSRLNAAMSQTLGDQDSQCAAAAAPPPPPHSSTFDDHSTKSNKSNTNNNNDIEMMDVSIKKINSTRTSTSDPLPQAPQAVPPNKLARLRRLPPASAICPKVPATVIVI